MSLWEKEAWSKSKCINYSSGKYQFEKENGRLKNQYTLIRLEVKFGKLIYVMIIVWRSLSSHSSSAKIFWHASPIWCSFPNPDGPFLQPFDQSKHNQIHERKEKNWAKNRKLFGKQIIHHWQDNEKKSMLILEIQVLRVFAAIFCAFGKHVFCHKDFLALNFTSCHQKHCYGSKKGCPARGGIKKTFWS